MADGVYKFIVGALLVTKIFHSKAARISPYSVNTA